MSSAIQNYVLHFLSIDLGKIVPTNPDEKGEAVNSINRLRAAATPFAQQMPCSVSYIEWNWIQLYVNL